jgi:predicted aspartyl protease
MIMPKTPHFAFKQEYSDLSRKLITEVEIIGVSANSGRKTVKVRALWDTGATGFVITPRIAQALNLVPVNKVKAIGVHNASIVDVVKIEVRLPNKVLVEDIKAMVCNLNQDFDMLIGMDIILAGDFSISNGGGQTLFTFAIPPLENKTDLYEKTLAANKRNKF